MPSGDEMREDVPRRAPRRELPAMRREVVGCPGGWVAVAGEEGGHQAVRHKLGRHPVAENPEPCQPGLSIRMPVIH